MPTVPRNGWSLLKGARRSTWFKLVPSDVEIWLHRDGAQIDSTAKCEVFEEWNFRTPREFIVAVSGTAVEMARAIRPAL